MGDETEKLQRYLDAVAPAVGLPIADEYRAGVVEQLARLWVQAALVREFPLPDDLEAAPVYRL